MPINIKKIPGFLRRHAAAIGAVAIFSVISLLLSILLTYKYKQQAQEVIDESLSFVQEKITSYDCYISNNRTKSLVRLLDKATELNHDIALDHSDLTYLLDSFCERQRLSGAIILDGALGCVAASTSDSDAYESWSDVINSVNVRNITARPAKCYMTRLSHDGELYDFAAISRDDQEGIVIVYKKKLPILDTNGEIDITTLFDNYPLAMNGIIAISDGDTIIGANSEDLRGMSVTECELLQTDFQRNGTITRSIYNGNTWYGGMRHSRNYTMYVFFPSAGIFSERTLVMTYTLSVGLVALMLITLARSISAHKHMAALQAEAERADRANISKTDFLRRMSHDLRTPINGIRGMVEISRHCKGDEKRQEECRDKIYEASGFLLELINDILDMNKLESGKIELENEPFDLCEMIDRVVGTIEPIAIEHNVRLQLCKPEIKHDSLIGSGIHLRRILHNLIGNAVKYNRSGGSVTVSCRELPASEYPETITKLDAIAAADSSATGCQASPKHSSPTNSEPHTDDAEYAVFELTVADTGIGMSREFQAHAFEPFAQENTASRASYMGTGLGLAIAHEIIEKMGGDIAFQSEQGKGTVFTVHLRFRINDHAVPTEKSRAELPHHSVIGANILLAEDNELNAEIAEFSLEHAGMTVTVAHDGSEALELFENSAIGEYDLILMDVMMPVLDGIEATRRIRASGRADAETVPIFAMTANAFSDDVTDCLAAGMNEHITKPINGDALISKIECYMAEKPTSTINNQCRTSDRQQHKK